MNRPFRNAALLAAVPLCALAPVGWARGASPYLPLNLAPEIERQIERVLILADKPVMSRPIAAATVLDALPAACRIDEALCQRVRRYLNRYMRKVALDHFSAEGAAANGSDIPLEMRKVELDQSGNLVAVDDSGLPLPNRYGMANDSAWQVSARAHWQANDYVIVSVGGVADADESVPAGSLVSLGFDWAQLDVGYRERWYSPFIEHSMLGSSEARPLPSVTLSNYRPLTSLGFTYEVSLAEMEFSDNIVFGDGFTAGHPRLAGIRVGIQPTPGWSLSANRFLQFGGGSRDGSFNLRALWDPSRYDNRGLSLTQDQEFGNQQVAFTSRFIFPGETPFAVYLEYAGEDTSYEGNYRLGNAALSIGAHFPRLWRHFDLVVEASEWQNGWYVNSLYRDGLTQDTRVLGHWGADQRKFGDAVGARTFMARVGWEPPFGGLLQLRGRTVENEDYSLDPDIVARPYQRGYDVTLSYSRTLRGLTAGAEVMGGRDVFGGNFSRLAGFVRFGDEWDGSSNGWSSSAARRPQGAELFVDAGVAATRVQIRLTNDSPKQTTSTELAPHVGIGARRSVTARSDLGVRAEIDRVDGELLLAVRALDYRYRFGNPLALSVFLGAARYNLATPAYGYYAGAGLQWRNVLPGFDVGVDLRYGDKVARDKLLPSDPASTLRPDVFYDITSAALSLSYRW